jgi:hypothetical protein
MKRHGTGVKAAKALGIPYARFLKLKKKLGINVKLGNNQKIGQYNWVPDSVFNRIATRYYACYRIGAKRRNIEFSISKETFKDLCGKSCHYCGSLEVRKTCCSGLVYCAKFNGIDRVDNNLGYIDSNCVSCCPTCNYAKRELSYNKFKKWIERLVEFKK